MSHPLLQVINGYHLANEVRRLSPRTIEWYDKNLKRFARWLADAKNKSQLDEVDGLAVREFFSHLNKETRLYQGHPFTPAREESLSPGSVLGYYTTLSAFFAWCTRETLTGHNPTDNVPRPKVPRTVVPAFSQDEIKRLLRACETLPDYTCARNRAILLFLLDTGVRINELAGLRWENLSMEEGRALVMGKGAKQRYVYLGAVTKRALWKYVSLFRPKPLPANNLVFLTRDSRPLHMRLIQSDLRDLGIKADVPNVHPHRFRHTAAVQFLRNGGNLFALQKMLGHTTLDMVRRYVELASEDVENAHRSASPADNWNL